MDSGDLLLAGDDSSWNMSDWHWDSHAFVAVPKLEQQSLSGCCKRRKTADASAIEVTARPCGGCKAIQHGPLKFLGDNAGSNSCSGSDGKHAFVVPQGTPSATISKAGRTQASTTAHTGESSCQADGCSCDLTKQSVWHQKSKICDKHMSGVFQKQGKAQQFCQQCGRSHNPDAFAEGRRSCRTQLAKHAARRRKQSITTVSKEQPEAGAQRKRAGTPAATGCRAAVSIAALAMQDTRSDAWFQTLCTSQKAAEDQSLAQPLEPGNRHSSCGSEQSQAKHTSFAQQIQPVPLKEFDSLPLHQQVVGAVGDSLPLHQQVVGPVGMIGSEAFMADAASSGPLVTSTPAWAADPAAVTFGRGDDPLQDVLSWHLPPVQDSKPELSSLDQAMAFMQDGQSTCRAAHVFAPYQPALGFAPAPGFDAGSMPTAGMEYSQFGIQAASANHGTVPYAQQAYTANNTAVRLSIKLFNCTPAQLPASLHERVTGWLGSTPAGLEGYIRPGCVHLTVQATMPEKTGTASPCERPSIRNAFGHLLASPEQEVWHKCTMLVQLGNEAAVVHEGTPLKVWNIQAQAEAEQPQAHQQQQQQQQQQQGQKAACSKKQSFCCGGSATLPSRLPGLSHAVCLVAGQQAEQRVTVVGQSNLADCKVLCRAGGKHLEVQVVHANDGSDAAADILQLVVPGELPTGLLYLEVQKGSFMGPALPVLIAPTPALAAEATTMLLMTQSTDRHGLILDLGCVMQHAGVSCQQSRQPQASAATVAASGGLNMATLLALMARAAQNHAPGMVRYLLSLVPLEDMEMVGKYRGAVSGMGLLHLAVQSGNMDILTAMLTANGSKCWQGELAGPAGITPFHLAVLLPSPQAVTLLLCATLGAGHWFASTTNDGLTAADFAIRCGKEALNHVISVSMWNQESAGQVRGQTDVDMKHQISESVPGKMCAANAQSSCSTEGWSDSSSSADDDSGSDVDGSLSVMPQPCFAHDIVYRLSAAADFVRDKKERLAAVLRESSWSTKHLVW